MKWLLMITLILSFETFGEENMSKPEEVTTESKLEEQVKTQNEKENEMINFNSLKKILKNDILEGEVQKKVDTVQKIKEERKDAEISKNFFPTKDDIWGFLSEYWLIRSAQDLKWDFEKPDYGIKEAINTLFRSQALIEKRIKILIINSPNLSHLALPGNNNESIFLISLPFIRTLDLTKQEIALMVLEDYLRLEAGYFVKYVSTKELNDVLGKNYFGRTMDVKEINKVLQNYSDFVAKKGFTFQEQYEVTKKMDNLLRSQMNLWTSYGQLISKIDRLVKMNLMYEHYIKLYPSPEMQLKWLNPKESK